jgi:hypothetical protein
MSSAIVVSAEQLHAQREELLRKGGIDYEELKRRAKLYTLRADERAIWESIRGIDFLLGDDCNS